MKPFFLTGANAKIKLNDITIAFATDISYRVEVKHADPRILGMYEGHSLEPLAYYVSGSFTIIRYTADAVNRISGKNPQGVQDLGNGIGSYDPTAGDTLAFNVSGKSDLRNTFNPRQLERASGFKIEIFQKDQGGTNPIARVKDARIEAADFSVSKKSPAVQKFTFRALYVDEDSFLTDFSGLGQHFQ